MEVRIKRNITDKFNERSYVHMSRFRLQEYEGRRVLMRCDNNTYQSFPVHLRIKKYWENSKSRDAYRRMEILSKRYRSTDDSTQVKNTPENANESSLLVLGSISQHQRTLRRPEKACADSEDCTSSDDESSGMRMDVHCTSTGVRNHS